MKIYNQAFRHHYIKPKKFNKMKTSAALDNSFLFIKTSPGVHMLTAIGLKILNKIKYDIQKLYEKHAYSFVKLPTIIPDSILNNKIDPDSQFFNKFINLDSPMSRYHLLSTDEEFILKYESQSRQSKNRYPVKVAYFSDYFRYIKKPIRILNSREFHVFATDVLVINDHQLAKEVFLNHALIKNLFNLYKIPYEVKNNGLDDYQYYYVSHEGDVAINNKINQKGTSIAYAFKYSETNKEPISSTYRNCFKNLNILTFAISLYRLIFSLLDACRDRKGFNFPSSIRPFYYAIIPTTADDLYSANSHYHILNLHHSVIMDDRCQLSLRERIKFAKYIGCKKLIIMHRGIIKLLKR